MKTKPLLTALVLALALPAAASATIVETFASHAAFTGAFTATDAAAIAVPGAPPVILSDYTVGDMAITALGGLLAGDGFDILSTDFDGDTLVIDFVVPIHAIGVFGGVSDLDFGWIDGSLLLEAVGSGSAILLANGGPAYLGLRSDIAFSQLRVSIDAFDTDAQSIAFAALQGQIDTSIDALPANPAVPEPGAWLLMVAGFGLVGLRQRASGRRSVAA